MSGMVRRIDSLGRLVIPKEMRILLNIRANDPVSFRMEGENVIVTKYSESKTEEIVKTVAEEIGKAINSRVIGVVGDKYVYGMPEEEKVSTAVQKLSGRFAADIKELPLRFGDTISNVNYTPLEIKALSCGIIAPSSCQNVVGLLTRLAEKLQ